MNGAQSLIRSLVDSGVDVCFGNPGTSEMHFVSALDDVPGMRGVLGLFEGVATGAADGYARMSGRPAATLLHLGPGLSNGLANLHNARRARSPMVNVVGRSRSDAQAAGRSARIGHRRPGRHRLRLGPAPIPSRGRRSRRRRRGGRGIRTARPDLDADPAGRRELVGRRRPLPTSCQAAATGRAGGVARGRGHRSRRRRVGGAADRRPRATRAGPACRRPDRRGHGRARVRGDLPGAAAKGRRAPGLRPPGLLRRGGGAAARGRHAAASRGRASARGVLRLPGTPRLAGAGRLRHDPAGGARRRRRGRPRAARRAGCVRGLPRPPAALDPANPQRHADGPGGRRRGGGAPA